jgi:RHS repeat-associated protein
MPFGEVCTEIGTISQTNFSFTGQRSISMLSIMDYIARNYDPAIGRFVQPDSIVPSPANPQSWNRFSYTQNNPVRYSDPSGHKACGGVDEYGNCDDEEENLNRLLDYVEDDIVNNHGKLKDKYPSSLGAMKKIVNKAAHIYGNDWDGFLNSLSYVFLGVNEHGASTMWDAHRAEGFSGYTFTATGFNSNFWDDDNQVRHFWAAFATAANPNGDNPFGSISAGIGNDIHDVVEDWIGRDDTTVKDFALSITAIDIAQDVGKEDIRYPSDLASVLDYRLGVSGPGSNGLGQLVERWAQWIWRTPYK